MGVVNFDNFTDRICNLSFMTPQSGQRFFMGVRKFLNLGKQDLSFLTMGIILGYSSETGGFKTNP